MSSVSAEQVNSVTSRVIGACIEVHRALGPGLLESAYEACLCHELSLMSVNFERQRPLPVRYKELRLNLAYRLDLVVENVVVVELKAVDLPLPVHQAQLLTYLKLTGLPAGLLVNFNSPTIRTGIKRVVNNLRSPRRTPRPRRLGGEPCSW
jgi:GxxExxY protein